MKSMTGYGRAKQELHGRTITAELRAVNHRYLDCTVKAPRQYGFLDDNDIRDNSHGRLYAAYRL